MNKSDAVKVRKLSAVKNAPVPTPQTADHVPGEANPGKSLPAEYEIEGALATELVVGKCFRVLRTKRNGVECLGIFESSLITSIETQDKLVLVNTENSVYEVSRL